MAFQTRTRDPLLDSDTQAIIERRGKEILGLLLLGIAVAIYWRLVRILRKSQAGSRRQEPRTRISWGPSARPLPCWFT